MRLPELAAVQKNTNMIGSFLGINQGMNIADNEFADMANMTNDNFPVLTTRAERGVVKSITGKFHGMANNMQKLVWCEGTRLYYDSTPVMDVEDSDKQFVMMGAWLAIFPDKKLYNTETREIKDIENEVTVSGATFTLCRQDGTKYDSESIYTGDTEPDHDEYTYWIDTSQEGAVVMKLWSDTESQWVSVGTTYVKIEAEGIGAGFKDYDGVKFSGVPDIGYNNYDFNTTSIVYAVDDDSLAVVGFINNVVTVEEDITLKRECPDLDFVCELDNRLWGCNTEKHEIYGCKLGDATNWNCFYGISTDSYAATVGSEGKFTGCASYRGSVLFFKDRGIHKLTGTMPKNFQMNFEECRGVQEGSERSLLMLNEYLFYKSREGFVMYDGSFPREISQALGTTPYYDAVAGNFRNKYYVCARDYDYNYFQFVYDTEKRTWVKEGTDQITGYGYMDGSMYFVMNKRLWVVNVEKILDKLFPNHPHFMLPIAGTMSNDHKTFTKPGGEAVIPDTRRLYLDSTSCILYQYSEAENIYNGIEGSQRYYTFVETHTPTYPAESRELWIEENYPYPDDDHIMYPCQYYPDLDEDVLTLYPFDSLYPNDVVKGEVFEGRFPWSCESGDIGLDMPYNKYVSKITFRFQIESGALFRVDIMYDSAGAWENLAEYIATKKKSVTIPMRLRRCDHFRIRLSGIGQIKVYSITKEIAMGSEM